MKDTVRVNSDKWRLLQLMDGLCDRKVTNKKMVMIVSTIKINIILRINIHKTNKYIQVPHYHIRNCRWSARMEGRKHAKIITIIRHTSHSSVPSLVAPRWQCSDSFLSPCPDPMPLQTLCGKLCINCKAC